MNTSPKTVLIASPLEHEVEIMLHKLAALPGFVCVGTARNLMECYAEIESQLPNLVVVSVSLTIAPEFEVMRALFETLDVRWLCLGGQARQSPRVKSDLFAVDARSDPQTLSARMREIMRYRHSARVSVVTRDSPTKPEIANRLILIGASTGGIDALLQVLRGFPPNCPPTAIVQHTGRGFGAGLVDLLARHCSAKVQHVEQPMPLEPGTISVGAGSGAHLVLHAQSPLRCHLEVGPPVSGHVPSVDQLFLSAVPFADRVDAALLTGMGSDGAEGLKALHDRGARTCVQDEATSVVFGMPRAAMRLGAADAVLPIDKIAARLLEGAPKRAVRQGVAS